MSLTFLSTMKMFLRAWRMADRRLDADARATRAVEFAGLWAAHQKTPQDTKGRLQALGGVLPGDEWVQIGSDRKNLLHHAVEGRDIPFCQMLLEQGWSSVMGVALRDDNPVVLLDVLKQFSPGRAPWALFFASPTQTPLETAIEQDDADILSVMLDNDISGLLTPDNPCMHLTRCVVGFGARRCAEELVKRQWAVDDLQITPYNECPLETVQQIIGWNMSSSWETNGVLDVYANAGLPIKAALELDARGSNRLMRRAIRLSQPETVLELSRLGALWTVGDGSAPLLLEVALQHDVRMLDVAVALGAQWGVSEEAYWPFVTEQQEPIDPNTYVQVALFRAATIDKWAMAAAISGVTRPQRLPRQM